MTTNSIPTALPMLPSDQRFTPTERQLAVYDALRQTPIGGMTLIGYGGAMGGGKTRAIAELAIDTALAFPGTNILIARQHYSNLQTTTMREFFECLPERLIVERHRSSPQWVAIRDASWPYGVRSTIHFRHLTEWSGLGSEQYGAVFVDEAGEVAEEAAQMLLTRLRHPAQPQRWFVAASNPWPGWFERWFARRELDESAFADADGRIVYIPAKIPDNPHLPSNYAAQQRALQPGEWVQRFIEGSFDAFEGQIYQHFGPDTHRWDAPLPSFARYIGGLDFGGQSPKDHYTAGIVAGLTAGSNLLPSQGEMRTGTHSPLPPLPGKMPIDTHSPLPPLRGRMPADTRSPLPPLRGEMPTGRGGVPPNILIRLGEFEERGPGVTQRLEQWQQSWQRKLGAIQWCADRSQSAWIDHQRRQGHHVVPSKGGPDSVNWGIALVQQRLNGDPPSSYYAPSMSVFPSRMREYQWDQSSTDHSPKPKKRNDDLVDADRYMHELATSERAKRTPFKLSTPSRGRDARWSDR
ncbi:MAG: phage terminase large subunit [Chloroflexi bacterium]|nr:phage terminase large subunit [Chloroflexota bacterium]